LSCTLEPPRPWDQRGLEAALAVRLPDDLCDFWSLCGGARLFVDERTSQWGLVLWPPEVVVSLAILRRDEWPEVAASLQEFLRRYLDAEGDMFWE
jgi:hypothetical protein